MQGVGRLAVCSGSPAALWFLLGSLSAGQLLTALIAAWVATGGWRTLRIAYRTLPREMRALRRFGYLLYKIKQYERSDCSVPDLFRQWVLASPNKTAILFEEQRWTFRDLDDYSNRVGNYFLSRGLRKGDSVAMFMENRPEYAGLWLGLAKVGIIPALINFNLKEAPLLHCVRAAGCSALVYGAELSNVVALIRDDLGTDFTLYCSGGANNKEESSVTGSQNLDELLESSPPSAPALPERLGYSDKLLYIYTSGTTGMPKAAVIKHSRGCYVATGTYLSMDWRADDVLYSPLPQYHTAGCLMGTLTALLNGCTVAQRRRFSVAQFWPDCVRFNATVSQYIGETCRYLLNQPEKPHDKLHQIRLMFGNGLRPQIWEEFERRFNIPRICEFYGSTEGNANVVNMEGHRGAVGFIPPLLPWVYPCLLVRVDEQTGQAVRDHRGLCVPCKAGEPGEFIGMMVQGNATRDFHGYADKSSTEKKILLDVKRKGDRAFRSGDILVQDEDGYLFFKDRTGDTFRWKGENVSTTEVEGIIQRALGSTMAAVYGVEVPGAEGRAGMAAVADPTGEMDLISLAAGLRRSLPTYAQPLFLRQVKQLDMTGTFKFKKVDLQREGFDLERVKDPLYFLNAKLGEYVPLTQQLLDNINNGTQRV